MPSKKHLKENDPPSKVEISKIEEVYRFQNLFKIIRADLRHEKFDGSMSEPLTRINFDRGESTGVLLYNPKRDRVVLVKQFRYPVYASLQSLRDRQYPNSAAWTLEIIAGVKDKGLTLEAVANKELFEEAGYLLKGELEKISEIYPSPGASSERITLFLANVDSDERVAQGGGVETEGEDIQIVELPFIEAYDKIHTGEIVDAKTVIALQFLQLKKQKG